MNENTKPTYRKKRKRSPSYPGIDLKTALDRARILRETEGENWVPIQIALEHWGYSPKSSPGMLTVAALKKFSLLKDQGSGVGRKIKLTDLAQSVLMDDRPDSPDREQAIKQAALSPNIHKKLWKQFNGDLPSFENLRYMLKADEGFTDRAADELISEFNKTIEFSKIDKSDIVSLGNEGREESEHSEMQPNQDTQQRGQAPMINKGGTKMINIPIPLSEGTSVVTIPETMSLQSWKKLQTILDAYKPEETNDTDEETQE